MKLVRWQSAPVSLLHDEFDRWIDRVFGRDFLNSATLQDGQNPVVAGAFSPPVNVIDRGDAIEVTAEVPGLSAEDVKITCENNVLTLMGEKRHEEKSEKDNVHRYECRYGGFRRAVELPAEVSADRAEASFKNGVLMVKLPKMEVSKPKEVKIKVKS